MGAYSQHVGNQLQLLYRSSRESLLEGNGFELPVPRRKSRSPSIPGIAGVSAGLSNDTSQGALALAGSSRCSRRRCVRRSRATS